MARFFSLFFKTVFWLSLFTSLGLIFSLWLWGIQSQPLVVNDALISQAHVDRVKHLLHEHDPRRMRVGQVYTVSANDQDINLVIGYLLKAHPKLAAKTRLSENSATLQTTTDLHSLEINGYLNFSLNLIDRAGYLVIEDVTIGDLGIPNWISRGFTRLLHTQMMRKQQYSAIVSAVQQYRIHDDNLVIVYEWQPELARQVHETGKKLIISEDDARRMVHYSNVIAKLSLTLPRQTSLERLLKPLYEETRLQTMQGLDASDENRAMLIALTFYIMGTDVNKHFNNSDDASLAKPRRLTLTLAKRRDLAKHFVLSAGITASAGKGIADALGLFKELRDSQGGTGFSFADLAADKAGVHLAELSISPRTAVNVQKNMSMVSDESDFMPAIDNLPEGIQELVFNHKYIAINDPAYLLVDNEIDRRIKNCAAFKL